MEEPTANADSAADDDAAEPMLRRIDDVITTKRNFDVAGFGVVRGITTHLTGALIGKSVSINNSAWPGYSGGLSDCVIDAYVRDLDWPTGPACALIVRTVDDGCRYAFAPRDIKKALRAATWLHAEKEMEILE